MADNLRLPFSGRVILDTNGDPVSGAKIEIFDAGTTNPKTIYTDDDLTTPGANPIVANSNGVVPARYIGTGDWKATFKDSSDVTLSNYNTLDNEPGALDTSSFLTGSVSASRPSVSVTTATTMSSAERGKQINCDATGGDFTYTLEAATAGGDATDIVVKNTGESGAVTVAKGGDNFILAPLDAATFRSDGATWHVASAYKATDNLVILTFDPSITPDLIYPSGANYQITATANFTLNNPTSKRPGTFFTVTIIQNATGGWECTFGSEFQDKPRVDIGANDVSVLGFHVRDASTIDGWNLNAESGWDYIAYNQQTAGTDGGTATAAGSFADVPLNTVDTDVDRFSLGNPSSNQVTFPPGVWEFEWSVPFYQTNLALTQLYDNTGTAVLETGTSTRTSSSDSTVTHSTGSARKTLSAASAISIQYRVSTTQASEGFGPNTNLGVERYAVLKARKVASL